MASCFLFALRKKDILLLLDIHASHCFFFIIGTSLAMMTRRITDRGSPVMTVCMVDPVLVLIPALKVT